MWTQLKREDGVALPVAAGVMLVIGLLVAAALATSVQLSNNTVRDQNAKRALSAAEAGLQAAVYRLNQIRNPTVPTTSCLTSAPVAPSAGGECPGFTESLGNAAQYTYYVTPWLSAGGTCVSMPGSVATTSDRCITSTGTVNGVSRRIQARVSEEQVFAGFNTVGLLGKSLLYAHNSVNMYSDIGSNGNVYLNNSVTVQDGSASTGKVLLGPTGTYTAVNSVSVEGGTQTLTQAYELPPVNFERVDGDVTGENNNSSLSSSYYNSTTKRFYVASGTVTLSPGTYYFCEFFLNESVKLRFTNSATTRIFIDSPSRTGHNCPSSGLAYPGTFGINNSVEFNKEVGQREDLVEIYVHGTPEDGTRAPYTWCTPQSSPVLPEECRSDVMLDNSVEFYGTIYAPDSTVQAHNSVKLWGGIAADKIRFYNSIEFNITSEVKNKPAQTPGAASRKGWIECKAQATTPSDPESGC